MYKFILSSFRNSPDTIIRPLSVKHSSDFQKRLFAQNCCIRIAATVTVYTGTYDLLFLKLSILFVRRQLDKLQNCTIRMSEYHGIQIYRIDWDTWQGCSVPDRYQVPGTVQTDITPAKKVINYRLYNEKRSIRYETFYYG